MMNDYALVESDIDREHSVFVGDAGGRTAELKKSAPKDFSCSDRNLAHNIGIKYQTPEEFFLGEEPRNFARDFDLSNFPFTGQEDGDASGPEKTNDQDIILFSGPPGAGKSTFYWKYMKPLGYERVNQDILKRSVRLMQFCSVSAGLTCFSARTSVSRQQQNSSREEILLSWVGVPRDTLLSRFVCCTNPSSQDNTNPDVETRSQWVALARKHQVPIRCLWFRTPLQLCEHNDAVRSLNKTVRP